MEFQGFCRDLHTEYIDHIVRGVPVPWQNMIRGGFVLNRALDRGNRSPGNIGADFARLGLRIWDKVKALDIRNEARLQLLQDLNDWRNAIAHQDFDPAKLRGRATLRLRDVNQWRRACDQLAGAFDDVTRIDMHALVGLSPW